MTRDANMAVGEPSGPFGARSDSDQHQAGDNRGTIG
jgi:hypothetical protein